MHPHVRRAAVPVLLLVLGLVACATPGGDVAATVGDVQIGLTQLETRAAVYRVVGRLSGQPCGAPDEGETDVSACNRFALSQLVQAAIARGYARANGIEVDGTQAEEAVAGFESGIGEEALSQALANEGVRRPDVVALVRDVLLSREVGVAIAEEGIGDDALRQAYRDGIARFTTVRAAHILVATRAEATDVYEQVTAPGATPSTFADLALDVSLDEGSGRSGGSLGSAVASTYVPEFADAIVALEPGEISQPVETEFGWHVIRLDDAQVMPFDEARPQLLQELAGDRYLVWLRGRVRVLEVEVNPRFGRLDPATVTVARVSSTAPDASPSRDGTAVAPATP